MKKKINQNGKLSFRPSFHNCVGTVNSILALKARVYCKQREMAIFWRKLIAMKIKEIIIFSTRSCYIFDSSHQKCFLEENLKKGNFQFSPHGRKWLSLQFSPHGRKCQSLITRLLASAHAQNLTKTKMITNYYVPSFLERNEYIRKFSSYSASSAVQSLNLKTYLLITD